MTILLSAINLSIMKRWSLGNWGIDGWNWVVNESILSEIIAWNSQFVRRRFLKISSLCLILLRNKKFFVSFREIIHSLFYRKIIENKLERNKYYFSSKFLLLLLIWDIVALLREILSLIKILTISMIDKSNFAKHFIKSIYIDICLNLLF